jgi:hypothetical protein
LLVERAADGVGEHARTAVAVGIRRDRHEERGEVIGQQIRVHDDGRLGVVAERVERLRDRVHRVPALRRTEVDDHDWVGTGWSDRRLRSSAEHGHRGSGRFLLLRRVAVVEARAVPDVRTHRLCSPLVGVRLPVSLVRGRVVATATRTGYVPTGVSHAQPRLRRSRRRHQRGKGSPALGTLGSCPSGRARVSVSLSAAARRRSMR